MAKLPLLSELTECPHCGCEEVYTRQKASGHVTWRQRFDGKECDNGEMYTGLCIYPSIWVYCACCEEKIARMDKDE